MAFLQFTPKKNAYLTVDIADIGNTHISIPIQHVHSNRRCIVLENSEFLDSLAGELNIYNYDASSNDDKKELKNEGYVGYLSYQFMEGMEAGEFTVQIHVSGEEFKRMTKNLSIGNNLAIINIETPLHGKDLRYANGPDDPIEWRTETNNWVHIEECKFEFEFCNHIKKGQESKKAKKVDDAPVYQEIEKLQQITQGINSILSTINSKLTVVVATLIAIALVLAFK